jgi:hypothetical protein
VAALVSVTGTFLKADLSPVGSGVVRFSAGIPAVTGPTPLAFITTGPVDVPVQPDGTFTALLVASDDPSWTTAGESVPYEVEVRVEGYRESFSVMLPSPGPHDLASLVHLT